MKRRRRKPKGQPPPVKVWPHWGPGILAFLERKASLLAFVLLAVASLRIVATYPVFNHTIDEPAHIACGLEWLDQGVYRYEHQHPPLARIAVALGPYLDGSRHTGKPSIYTEGGQILYGRIAYDRTLMLARLGILPFFWLGAAVTFLWARNVLGRPAAVLALLLFTTLPPVLAHAGLATTDMALTSCLLAACFAMVRWLERPTLLRSVLLGAAAGAATLSEFSALAFLPAFATAALAAYVVMERPRTPAMFGRATCWASCWLLISSERVYRTRTRISKRDG